ncbi:hypothetical protein MMC15_003400 [Xylographa vitiligo]|nr:hypothetical protein [Xylographa vitiligo]
MLIRSFGFTECNGENRWTAYKSVRKVYDHFAPIHLKRIQSGVAWLREPILESLAVAASAENESEQPDPQEMAMSAPSSQDTAEVILQIKQPINKLDQEREQNVQEWEQNAQKWERMAQQMAQEMERATAKQAQ